ncbi:MAG TPA: 2-C-methyl-D-erythritol 4-phosphate cytidylyltransferase [Pyrinomonadaceae bacterium]|jgi:2-C-methyl-D-erythritol 4-phosphate cytidylyltransferase|nr:2-C-methyl-D-erythritol 4-phosphate cytidylyltransferase [Pyrinomonadaceae bacterium]
MNVAIVVAGGKGLRFGGDRPKQFLEVNGSPIIIHTLRQFERCREIGNVVVVLPAEETAGFQSLIAKFALQKVTRIVAGGVTRAQSVKQGLATIEGAEVVAVHDGVRPLVTPAEIDSVVKAASESGAAILVARVSDTIKDVRSDCVVNTLPRVNLRRALTPQCFRMEVLKQAYEELERLEAAGIEVTDDSFLVERLGINVTTIEGNSVNIKITKAEDLAFAEAFLKSVARTNG